MIGVTLFGIQKAQLESLCGNDSLNCKAYQHQSGKILFIRSLQHLIYFKKHFQTKHLDTALIYRLKKKYLKNEQLVHIRELIIILQTSATLRNSDTLSIRTKNFLYKSNPSLHCFLFISKYFSED